MVDLLQATFSKTFLEYLCNLIEFSLNVVPKSLIDKPSLIYVTACRRSGDKPLHEWTSDDSAPLLIYSETCL